MSYGYVKPTKYAGILFRSRLEARWAVFFDALGIAWEYEPETFVRDGHHYTPDFAIPANRDFMAGERVYVEVKPTEEAITEAMPKMKATSLPLVIVGPVPPSGQGHPLHPVLYHFGGEQRWEWMGFYRSGPAWTGVDESPKLGQFLGAIHTSWPASADVQSAYNAARNERFDLHPASRPIDPVAAGSLLGARARRGRELEERYTLDGGATVIVTHVAKSDGRR